MEDGRHCYAARGGGGNCFERLARETGPRGVRRHGEANDKQCVTTANYDLPRHAARRSQPRANITRIGPGNRHLRMTCDRTADRSGRTPKRDRKYGQVCRRGEYFTEGRQARLGEAKARLQARGRSFYTDRTTLDSVSEGLDCCRGFRTGESPYGLDEGVQKYPPPT